VAEHKLANRVAERKDFFSSVAAHGGKRGITSCEATRYALGAAETSGAGLGTRTDDLMWPRGNVAGSEGPRLDVEGRVRVSATWRACEPSKA
jgi:hypothetical protein